VDWPVTQLQRPDATVWCWDSGGPGLVVLLLHGLAGYAGEWDATAEALAGRFRVLAIDQRGHGRSTRRPADLSRTAYVSDVVAVIDEMAGDGPLILVGQSMGAHTAMLTAATRPDSVDRLVMIEGGVGGGGPGVVHRVEERLASWPVPFSSWEAALEYFGGDTPTAQAWAGGLETRRDGLWPRFDVDVMATSLAFVEARACWSEWSAIIQPVLLVLGETGIVAAGEVAQMTASQPDAEVVVVADAGHDLHLEQTEAWLGALQGFLAH